MLQRLFHTVVLCVVLCLSSSACVTAHPSSRVQNQLQNQRGATDHAPDVFLIGLPYTGLEALLSTLCALGYRHKHPLVDEISHSTSLDVTNTEGVQHPYAEVFFGMTYSLMYADHTTLFPEAKFILTVRNSEDDWLWHLKHDNDGFETFQEQMSEEAYREEYQRHAKAVRKFFESNSAEDRFLELIVDGDQTLRGKQLRQLCQFLDIDCGAASSAHGLGAMELRRQLDLLERSPFIGKTLRRWIEAVLLETLDFVAWLTALNL